MSISILYSTNGTEFDKTTSFNKIPKNAMMIWTDFQNPDYSEKDLILKELNLQPHQVEESIYLMSRPKFIINTKKDIKYVVLHSINDRNFSAEPMSLTMDSKLLVTIHENEVKEINQLKETLVNQKNNDINTNIIALKLINLVTKHYFKYIDHVENSVFSFENKNVDQVDNKKLMDDVYDIRSEIIKLKRVLLPMEQLMEDITSKNQFEETHESKSLINHIHSRLQHQKDTLMSCEQITDDIKDNNESYRSNRINRVMNVLTIISSIFFPLSFLTGWYGMNFSYMPELNWHYSYFVFIALSIIVTLSLIFIFKKKEWF